MKRFIMLTAIVAGLVFTGARSANAQWGTRYYAGYPSHNYS